MIQISLALELSFYLGLLNYVIGTLLLGSPIPFPSVKRLGALMIKDAIVIWILASSFTLILNLVSYIKTVLGLSWESFHDWIGKLLLVVTSYLTSTKITSYALGSISSFFSPIISRITSLLSTSLVSLIALKILSIIVSTKTPDIIALGVLIYSIPLGIFKRAGALLISFALVFSIALPAMPLFISALITIPNAPDSKNAYPYIEVRDLTGGLLGSSLLLVYQTPDKTPGSEEAMIPVNEQGVVAINLTPGLPANRRYYFSLEMFGWILYSSSSIEIGGECVETTCRYTITVDGVLVSDSPYIVIQTPPTLINYVIYKDEERGYIRILMSLTNPSVLIVMTPAYTMIRSLSIDGNITGWDDKRPWSWAGLDGYSYYKLMDRGTHVIEIQYARGNPTKPMLYPYYNIQQDDLLVLASNIILLLFVATIFPTVYLTLLGMATYSLARLIEKGAR